MMGENKVAPPIQDRRQFTLCSLLMYRNVKLLISVREAYVSAVRKHGQPYHCSGAQDGGRHEGHFDACHGRQKD